jgi:uncharacterized protein (DUF433 family)
MTIAIEAEAPPLRQDDDGALRIGKTRVLLDLVIQAFQDGATSETIVQQYSALSLSDVNAVIAYYLRHGPEIDAYLAEREQGAQEIRKKIDARQGDLSDIRARLVARGQS